MREQHTLYYTPLCPECPPFIAELEKQGITFEKVDITENIKNLKRFIQLRDKRIEFEEQKKCGFIGVPAFHTSDDQFIFNLNDLMGTTCAPTNFKKN
ncbi:glutaredoxin [Gemella sp. GH3]|uniref:glutaredoxin n=1 Tax=unclassified Gemella TaxID=2624949 RepID=UPI0015D0CD47|nr:MULTISPECIES: glutaredoxin [unclassified Gemella]MBF0714201.1 glutaredoxin [Gemella sp. GH3.1]NYS51153.1 glutaredoxin [Gemella sp. GH3]